MNRLLRLTRFRRLDRAAPRAGVGLPADVAADLALGPVRLYNLRYASLPGHGQILHQDAARTTPVTELTDPIGSVVDLVTGEHYLTSSGTQRPLWDGLDGGLGDGLDDRLLGTLPDIDPPWTIVLRLRGARNNYPADFDSGNSMQVRWFAANSNWRMLRTSTNYLAFEPSQDAPGADTLQRMWVRVGGSTQHGRIVRADAVSYDTEAVVGTLEPNPLDALALFASNDGAVTWAGRITSVAIYDGLRDPADLDSLPLE